MRFSHNDINFHPNENFIGIHILVYIWHSFRIGFPVEEFLLVAIRNRLLVDLCWMGALQRIDSSICTGAFYLLLAITPLLLCSRRRLSACCRVDKQLACSCRSTWVATRIEHFGIVSQWSCRILGRHCWSQQRSQQSFVGWTQMRTRFRTPKLRGWRTGSKTHNCHY